jgi:hypothetical protein
MILVGGGAVNFYGYQRHSADVDFWIDISDENLDRLKVVLNEMEYLFEEFPTEVKSGLQNISVKISPVFDIELISRFNPGKTFDEAYAESVITTLRDNPSVIYRVLQYADLINSKIKSGRPKDLLDIQELNRLRNIHDESE